MKKNSKFLLLLIGWACILQAQEKNQNTHEYGFQINELGIPKSAPYGYESIVSVALNTPLRPNRKYEVGFWIIGKQLRDRGYSYPITVFPSNFMDTPSREIFSLVKSNDIIAKLEVNPPPSYSGQGHFIFTIQPDTLYNYVTIVLKNSDFGRAPIDFDKDVTVTGIFVRPLKQRPIDSVTTEAKPEIKPKILAERVMIDSKKNYTVSEQKISIGLYDHRNIDKDVVTIYLNGEIVVENLELRRKKKMFALHLKVGTNTIMLHAENLGEVPPNTAAILIKSKTKEFTAVLASDLGQSEYFTITYAPE